MASTKTRTKTIRIANETADYFEDKPLNRLVESVHTLLREKKLAFDGENVRIPGVCSDSLKEMVSFFDISYEDFLEDVSESLNDGRLTVENGRVKCVLPEWAERLEDICHDKGVAVEKMIEIVRKM